MEQLFNDFVQHSSIYQKGVFLMITGLGFVFSIQVIFYLLVKLWPRKNPANN